jgi:hypothetical protein
MFKHSEQSIIHAPAQTVFEVFTDLSRYPQWNPWNVAASGPTSEGSIVQVTSILRGQPLTVAHRVLTSQPAREFRWCDVGWFTALAYGETARWLEPRADGGVTYRVELCITGLLSQLVTMLFGPSLRSGLKAETHALKLRAEALAKEST